MYVKQFDSYRSLLSYFEWFHGIDKISKPIQAAKHYCCSIITEWNFLKKRKIGNHVNICEVKKSENLTFCSISLVATDVGSNFKISRSLLRCSWLIFLLFTARAWIYFWNRIGIHFVTSLYIQVWSKLFTSPDMVVFTVKNTIRGATQINTKAIRMIDW